MGKKDEGVISATVEKKTLVYAVGEFKFDVTLNVSTRNELDIMLRILAQCKEDCEKLLAERFGKVERVGKR